MYRPGELDQRIEVFRLTVVDDGYGGETQTPASLGTFWAKVKPMGGNEKKGQERVHDTANYRFILRYTDKIKEDDYIVWSGSEFNVRFIPDCGSRHLYLEIDAEKNAQR